MSETTSEEDTQLHSVRESEGEGGERVRGGGGGGEIGREKGDKNGDM